MLVLETRQKISVKEREIVGNGKDMLLIGVFMVLK